MNSISQDPKPLDYTELKDKLEEKLERITGTGGLLEKFAEGFDGGFSLNQVDMIQEAQKNYREALQKRFENALIEPEIINFYLLIGPKDDWKDYFLKDSSLDKYLNKQIHFF